MLSGTAPSAAVRRAYPAAACRTAPQTQCDGLPGLHRTPTAGTSPGDAACRAGRQHSVLTLRHAVILPVSTRQVYCSSQFSPSGAGVFLASRSMRLTRRSLACLGSVLAAVLLTSSGFACFCALTDAPGRSHCRMCRRILAHILDMGGRNGNTVRHSAKTERADSTISGSLSALDSKASGSRCYFSFWVFKLDTASRIFRCGHSVTCDARVQALSQNPWLLIIGQVSGQIVRFPISRLRPPCGRALPLSQGIQLPVGLRQQVAQRLDDRGVIFDHRVVTLRPPETSSCRTDFRRSGTRTH